VTPGVGIKLSFAISADRDLWRMKPRIYPFGLSPQCPQEFRRRIVSYSGHGGEFKGDTGIAVYKCHVSSYDACVAGVSEIEKALGPVEVLVSGACYLTGRINS
jgi:hypothetical protein